MHTPSHKLPTLFTFRRCPYAIRARMALAHAGIAYHAIEVSLKAKPPELLALSPKGTVPVLSLPTGEVIDQSLDIMRWALQQSTSTEGRGIDSWQTPHNAALNPALADHWLHLCDGVFKPLLDRYKYPQRYTEQPQAAYRAAAVAQFMQPLEQSLVNHRLADCPRWVEVALFPFVRQFAAVDPVWFEAEDWPALKAWLVAWLNSKLFCSVMQKTT